MLCCSVLELALLTSPLAAQTGAEARTSVRLFGGTALNQPLLWSMPRQPILVPGTQAAPQYDTLALTRSLAPGLTVGVAFTHCPTSHLGLAGRLAYLGLERASGCSGVYYNGVQRDNEGLCTSIQGQRRTQGLMMLDLQGIARMMPHSAVTPSLHAGLTLTTALGSGYQVAFDLSDTWLGFPVVAGPANATAHAPTTTHYTRHTVFTLGLDFVLDGKRGRRY